MKRINQFVIVLLLVGCIGKNSFAASDMFVDEIVTKANHVALYQGDDSKGKLRLTISDKQGRKREREINVLRKDIGSDDQDQMYFTYFVAPSDVRKMVFMVHKHAQVSKDDDRWLYMPGLDLVKRIAASDKRTSFVGSDFLYEDISGRSPLEDVHELIKETEKYYVIKNTPKEPDSVEFEYYIAFIDRKTFIPMKMQYFKKQDRLYREIEAVSVELIESNKEGESVLYPTVTKSIARDMETGSTTEMSFSNIQYNCGLDESFFSERYLRRPPREAIQ